MASPKSSPRIIELAAKISASVTELRELLSAQGLLMEPIPLTFKFSATTNMISLDALCRFHIADIVPPGGQVSFGHIAEKTGLEEQIVRRLLRHAMSMRILKEPEPGMVAHTKISKYFTLPYVNAWLSVGAQEGWPAATRMLDAIQKWPGSEELNNTGFSLVNNTDKSIFEVLGTNHDPHDFFPGYATAEVSQLYDWGSLGSAVIAHIGGARGEIAIEIAKNFHKLKLIVQDIDKAIAGAEADVPNELQGCVEFKAYGLFDAQALQADVYLFRLVFQVWTDQYAILIQDLVMPEPGDIPLWRDREFRSMDLNAGASFNGRNRYLHEWKALLAAADERFVLKHVTSPGRSLLSTLEVVWDPSSSAKA
ncbi:sterigmatocystin 8-O-methyltransferase [Xylaria grammica]|nr:sterigmatocystin 8-O-methyltransferase [Xylaria grammica]